MKASKELLTFIIAKQLEHERFAKIDEDELKEIRKDTQMSEGKRIEEILMEEKELAANRAIANFCNNLYYYMTDPERFEEEIRTFKESGGHYLQKKRKTYWKEAEEELKKREEEAKNFIR